MNYLNIMQDSIDYIENNLKSELSAHELASKAGFSRFHYYHLFQGAIGIPVVQYILRRKLYNSLYEISLGEKIIDAALDYGFETHAGFFKAFKREFHCSPREYLRKYKVIKPYRINLKQEECIMITDKRLKAVLANWELEAPLNIKSFYYGSSGNKSENIWIVNETYILKVTTNIIRLKQHINMSKALRDVGILTSVPIATKDNTDYFEDGNLFFCLTNRIKGESIKSSEMYQGDYKSKARYFGKVIGQLHLIFQEQDKDFVCNEPNLYETIKDWAIPEVKKYVTQSKEFFDDYLDNFKKLHADLPKHVIHRDPNPSNIIMNNGKLAAFIDFELSERNIRIFDPCYAATSILSETFDENDSDKLKKWIIIFNNILEGYDSVCKLTDQERQAIPYVIYSIQMICVAYFSSMDKYVELFNVNKKILTWLIENRDNLIV